MRRFLIVLLALLFIFTACSTAELPVAPPEYSSTDSEILLPSEIEFEYDYLTFEEAILEFATDVVIAQYVGHRAFSEEVTEFEFIVSDRILGNAADRIFVYLRAVNANVSGGGTHVYYNPGDLAFVSGVNYLIPLTAINSPYAKTHEDGFVFIRNIVVNLDDPQSSMMYSESLHHHIEGINFNSRSLSREMIEMYVDELTEDIDSPSGIIRSEVMEDILLNSPYVLVVEINEAFRMSHQQGVRDFVLTDIYNATIVQVLKGDTEVGNKDGEFAVIFFADTVFPGEKHIVAVNPIEAGSPWFRFTSPHSLFSMNQLDEILAILGN